MAQSIKLGSNTYLDSSGVVVDSSGITLKTYLTTVSETIVLGSGITLNLRRKHNTIVCSLAGSASTAKAAGDVDTVVLPVAWRPVVAVELIMHNSSATSNLAFGALLIATNGQITYRSAVSANAFMRGSVCYLNS